MASQGPQSAGTGVDDASVGTTVWSGPGDIITANGTAAFCGPGLGSTYVSHYLKATNFGFSIPSGATIDGIVVEIKRASMNATGAELDNLVKLVKGGTISGNDKADGVTVWPINSAFAYATYGSASDLWGLSWTPTDINDNTFGVAISSKADGSSGNNAPGVDHIRITVYYTPLSNPASVPSIPTISFQIKNQVVAY